MARPSPALPRTIGAVIALFALMLAACSKSSSPTTNPTPSPVPTVTIPGAPTPTAPALTTGGIAYLPDGGNGGTFQGIQVVPFEDIDGALLPGPQGQTIRFAGAVGVLGLTSDSSDVVAALSTTGAAPFNYAQDVFGGSSGSLIPVGDLYNMAIAPTPAPSATPSPLASPPTIVPDAYTMALLGTTSTGLALVTGPAAGGILGLTSLTNAPPQYGGFVPFAGGTISPPQYPRTNIIVEPTSSTYAIVRGPMDAEVLSITYVATGYQFNVVQYSALLGYGTGTLLRGSGAMAISPEDPGRAVFAQTPGANGVTLITGLPKTITFAATMTLPSHPHVVAIAPSGGFAIVGADAGFYVIGNIATGSLVVETPFVPSPVSGMANSPAYVGCDGQTHYLQNITGVGFAASGRYLVLLGTSPGISCPFGYNSTIVVLPFNESTGSTPSPAPTASPSPTPNPNASVTPSPSPSPQPTMFTQNGIITQPSDSSLMVVR